MRKKSVCIILLMILPILLYHSCKKANEEEPLAEYKIAMLASGASFDDRAFLLSCKEGAQKAGTDFDLHIEYNIDTSTNEYLERLTLYGDRGFDMIIAIGYMWNEAVTNAAQSYPDSRFVLVDAKLVQSPENTASILFDVDEAAFPLGFLAAYWADRMDATGPVLGSIGAMYIPQIRQFIEPFNKGAMRFNMEYDKNVDTINAYTNSFIDQEKGAGLADSLIELGADVIFGVGSETGNGALLKAKEKSKWAIGVDVDQYYSFPEVSDRLLSSAMKGLDHAVYDIIRLFVEENFPSGSVYHGKLSNQGVGMAPYHDYEDLIPDSVKTNIEYIREGIMDGSISTGW
ncbi:MAG: BMP family ABC transporter substrate-binding protein [Bacteroidales bacterium]|nr:BMP family ABC transporter substrate-binding protein [Bacteroidales bacterium]MCF8387532.1 BMP family ABC transporter substrate-binding protein [Bacteroidales bacterium]MCF8398087.1 BMP family ABC transporter substrate-binding protein [Bacteroidales bacterium]